MSMYRRRLSLRLTGDHFFLIVFFFNDTATTEIYTLSLHDALPICPGVAFTRPLRTKCEDGSNALADRKSTRLNSSHLGISYAVFCLKKKRQTRTDLTTARNLMRRQSSQ